MAEASYGLCPRRMAKVFHRLDRQCPISRPKLAEAERTETCTVRSHENAGSSGSVLNRTPARRKTGRHKLASSPTSSFPRKSRLPAAKTRKARLPVTRGEHRLSDRFPHPARGWQKEPSLNREQQQQKWGWPAPLDRPESPAFRVWNFIGPVLGGKRPMFATPSGAPTNGCCREASRARVALLLGNTTCSAGFWGRLP